MSLCCIFLSPWNLWLPPHLWLKSVIKCFSISSNNRLIFLINIFVIHLSVSIFLLKTKVYYQTTSQSDTLSSQENFPHLFPMHKFSLFHIQKIVCCYCLVTESSPALCNFMDCSTPGFSISTISQGLLKFMSIESVMLSNHLILCQLLLLCLPFSQD